MARMDTPGIWEKIQNNVQETERLIGQKKYNQSMITARQTLEYMVKLQCDKSGIVQGSVNSMIQELRDGGWISKSTAEHYLQILSIGNKAKKEGDNSAYNANQAYHILSQEVYVFSDSIRTAKVRRGGSDRRSQKSLLQNPELLKLLIPIVLVIILIILIRVLSPKKTPTNETLPPAPTTEAAAMTEPQTEATTEATEAPVSYKTTTTLNVRKGPSTDFDKIGKLDPGASVNFISDYDDNWALIRYNEQDAYVAKEYLTPVE